ncbi:MAG: hypothetical protein LBE08_04665 [Bifidobacteriaceae bacterium]|nr:hypothetical protein [Bifidobacteriaceae bacterium]
MVATFLAAVAMSSACTAGTDEAEPARSSSAGAGGPYTGPWAADFAELAEHTDLTFALGAIADSEISDQEAEEARGIVSECYAAKGYTVDWDAYGYETAEGPEGSDDGATVMGECSFADGGVLVLYYQILVNPGNDDMMELSAVCLAEEGLVEKGFTGDDLEAVYQADDFAAWPLDVADPVFQRCMRDPRSLVGN